MESVVVFACAAAAIVFLWWCERSEAKALQQEDMRMAEAIKHLPVEKQAEIWAAKLRSDADRDLH